MFWGASPEPDSRNMAGKSPARACPRTFGRVNVPGVGARWLAPPSVTACACVSSTCACVSSVSGRMASPRARACPRCLAVWPLHSLGVWPYGLWTLAAWRCLICARSRLGLRSSRGRMVCNLPRSLPHTCSRPLVVPHVPSPPPGLRLPFWRASWCVLSTSSVGLRATAAGRRECDRAVMWIRWG